jgi:hypothetical protein
VAKEQKQHAAKTKAKFAIKAAASAGQREQKRLVAKSKAKLAFMAAVQLTPKSIILSLLNINMF